MVNEERIDNYIRGLMTTTREKVLAIEKYFDFNTDLDTITYSWEENASILFDNSFIEWRH